MVWTSSIVWASPIDNLLERIDEGASKKFITEEINGSSKQDFFELDQKGQKVVVRGNNQHCYRYQLVSEVLCRYSSFVEQHESGSSGGTPSRSSGGATQYRSGGALLSELLHALLLHGFLGLGTLGA